MKRQFLIFLVLIFTIKIKSQSLNWQGATKEEIISSYRKSFSWFTNTTSYSFKLRYASFKDAVSKVPIETSEGYYKRQSNSSVTEAMGIKTIQNASIRLSLDTVDKIITVMDPGNLSPVSTNQEELENLLNNARTFKKIRRENKILYRIEFKKNPQYEAYEFLINDNGILECLICYYSERIEKTYPEKQLQKSVEVKMTPRLEISFFDHQAPIKYFEKEFNEQNILQIIKGKIIPNILYKDFRILDYRLQSSK